MAGLGNELVATYYLGQKAILDVYGCWDGDTQENKFDFYDLYLRDLRGRKTSECINLGDPFHSLPTRNQVKRYYEEHWLVLNNQ